MNGQSFLVIKRLRRRCFFGMPRRNGIEGSSDRMGPGEKIGAHHRVMNHRLHLQLARLVILKNVMTVGLSIAMSLVDAFNVLKNVRTVGLSIELGGRLQRFGECHDGRAFSSNEFGGHRQRFGVCHEGRALTGTVLGDGRHHPGVCQDSRALSGTVLGVHQPLPCECPDHRAFGTETNRGTSNLNVMVFVIPRWKV